MLIIDPLHCSPARDEDVLVGEPADALDIGGVVGEHGDALVVPLGLVVLPAVPPTRTGTSWTRNDTQSISDNEWVRSAMGRKQLECGLESCLFVPLLCFAGGALREIA